jgi:hypothetical protein
MSLNATSFATDILPLFRPGDIVCMARPGVLLDNYAYMSQPANAQTVYDQLSEGKMPPDAPWPQTHVALFKSWMDGGRQP